MKYEIKQLNEIDAVVISDEEIEKDDYYISLESNYASHPKGKNVLYNLITKTNGKNPKKIIATISPYKIEGLPMLELPNREDVEKLGRDRAIERNWHPDSMETRRVANEIIEAVKYGYKAAQKQYSESDMEDMAEAALEWWGDKNSKISDSKEFITTYLQSLQKKQFPIAVELTEDLQIIKWYYK